MNPTIIIKVPADVTAIAAICAEYSGTIEFTTPSDEAEAAAFLMARCGKHVSIEFDDPSDPLDSPLDAIEAIAKILDGQNGEYVLLCDAFVEPSRGIRVLGRVVINDGEGPQKWDVPWQHGEPKLDMATLVACGVDHPKAEAFLYRWRSA